MAGQDRNKPIVFLSYITEEVQLANILKSQLDDDFLGQFDIFVASDPGSVSVGSKWLDRITNALKTAELMLVLCSRESLRRPWINFEAGAGWVREIPVIPVCHTDVTPAALRAPFQLLQGVQANNTADLERLYRRLSDTLGTRMPRANFPDLAAQVKEFEHEYGLVSIVRTAVSAVLDTVPRWDVVFSPNPEGRRFRDRVLEIDLDKIRQHLDVLRDKGMLQYQIGEPVFAMGGYQSGMQYEVMLELSDAYYQIAPQVIA